MSFGLGGKCNAARAGAKIAMEAGAEYLLFTDADVLFDPDLVQSAVALSIRENSDLLSALTTLTSTSWEEFVVQPVASLNLVRMHPTDLVNRTTNPRAFANGQFMLFTRSIYETIGGHDAVSEDLLEDIAFARSVREVARAGVASWSTADRHAGGLDVRLSARRCVKAGSGSSSRWLAGGRRRLSHLGPAFRSESRSGRCHANGSGCGDRSWGRIPGSRPRGRDAAGESSP